MICIVANCVLSKGGILTNGMPFLGKDHCQDRCSFYAWIIAGTRQTTLTKGVIHDGHSPLRVAQGHVEELHGLCVTSMRELTKLHLP